MKLKQIDYSIFAPMKRLVGAQSAMDTYKPYIAMIIMQFLYAGMALFSKMAILKGMSPYVFVVYRQAFASVTLAPFALFFESNKDAPLSYSLLGKIFLVSFFGPTLSSNLYCVAMNYTTATFAAAAINTIPAITFVMATLLRMESITIKHLHGIAKVLGAVIGVSGALVFAFVKGPLIKITKWDHSTYEQLQAHTSSSVNSCCSTWDVIKGPLIMISSNTLWALWLVLQGLIVKQYPSKLRLTTLQCFFSCIQSTCWAVANERNPSTWKLGWDAHLLSVAYCGIIVNGVTYYLQVWAVERKGPVFIATFTPLQLIITAIFSVIIWKETLYLGSVGGAILLVVGLYSVLWGKSNENGRTSATNEPQSENIEAITLESIARR